MGQHVSRSEYEWSYTEEPHASRRKEILAKYPQIKGLMGPDPNTKWKVLGMVLVQILAAFLLRSASIPVILVVAYCFGGVINHAMALAIHEISHNLAFGHSWPMSNRYLGIFGNTIMAVPSSITFKKYHLDHHKYQGDEDYDVDIPSRIEGALFTNTFTKLIWVILQPLFYAIRPLVVMPKTVTFFEVVNAVAVIGFDVLIFYTMGPRSLFYLLIGTLLAMGLHPVAGHFIAEHFMFVKGYETYSYYGPLNIVAFNVGYHNEHHDFPYVAGCNLPELRKIAPEYYNHLPQTESWPKTIYNFIMDPDISLFSRVKRKRIPRQEEKSQ